MKSTGIGHGTSIGKFCHPLGGYSEIGQAGANGIEDHHVGSNAG